MEVARVGDHRGELFECVELVHFFIIGRSSAAKPEVQRFRNQLVPAAVVQANPGHHSSARPHKSKPTPATRRTQG